MVLRDYFSLTCVLGVLAVACGEAEDSSPAAAGGGNADIATLDDLLAKLPSELCAYYERCPEYGALFARVISDSCTMTLAGIYEGLGDMLGARISAGTVSFDPDAAEACLAEYRTAPCTGETVMSQCETVFSGNVAAGDACFDDTECQSGTHCDDGSACPGVCVPDLPAGATCLGALDCSGDLQCNSARVCAEPLLLDAPCSSSLDCGSGYCNLDTGLCAERAPYSEKSLGQVCRTLECQQGLYCDIVVGEDSTCKETLAAGQACSAVGFENQCDAGLYCDIPEDSDAGVCAATVAVGQPCASDAGCQGGVCDAGTCARRERLGGPCVTDERCFSDYCEAGSCAAPPLCPAEE